LSAFLLNINHIIHSKKALRMFLRALNYVPCTELFLRYFEPVY